MQTPKALAREIFDLLVAYKQDTGHSPLAVTVVLDEDDNLHRVEVDIYRGANQPVIVGGAVAAERDDFSHDLLWPEGE
jgi:hypothetical protein